MPSCHFVNEYAELTGLVIGNTYEIGTNVAGTNGITTTTAGAHILTLYDGTGAVLTSQVNAVNNLINITFTATTTTVRVQTNTYAGGVCGNTGSYCHYYGLRCTSCTTSPGAPACPALNSPASNALNVSTTPTLSWFSAVNASSYDVYLDTDLNCTTMPTTLIANVTTTSYTITTPLSASTQYRWMVVPKDCGGNTPASCFANARCFTTVFTTPANDVCANAIAFPAIPMDGTCASLTVQTGGATGASDVRCIGTEDDDVWYTFTVPAGSISVAYMHTEIAGTTDRVIQLFSGNCPGINLGCYDPESGIFTGLTGGATYLLRVYTKAAGAYSTFTSCLSIPPPANDECINATTLIGTSGAPGNPGAQTLIRATQSQAPVLCSGEVSTSAQDVWYRFQTNANGGSLNVTVDPTDATGDPIVELFGGTCDALGSIRCTDAGTDGVTEILSLSNLAPGFYYLRVYGWNGSVFPFTIALSGSAFPLELKSFTGQVQGTMNILHWETLTEKNVQSHVVERSVDGQRWAEVGRVAGQGDSQVSVKYSLEDRSPVAKAYYRLRSVDFDGKENRSTSILLTRKSDQFGITSIYPSPTNGNVTMQFNATAEEKVTVRVMDMTGRLVMEQYTEAVQDINELPIELTNLQAGVYTVTVSNSTGASAPVRFVKQ